MILPGFQVVTDRVAQAEVLRRRHYGVIETAEGRFRQVVLRPYPKIVSWDMVLLSRWRHAHRVGDRCWVYYNQPWRMPDFLALAFIESTRRGSLASVRKALEILDEIARLKRVQAIVCDVANRRISDRWLRRWGWSPHCPSRWHRHYIKRFTT